MRTNWNCGWVLIGNVDISAHPQVYLHFLVFFSLKQSPFCPLERFSLLPSFSSNLHVLCYVDVFDAAPPYLLFHIFVSSCIRLYVTRIRFSQIAWEAFPQIAELRGSTGPGARARSSTAHLFGTCAVKNLCLFTPLFVSS